MSNCTIVHVQYTLALDNKYTILSCDLRPLTLSKNQKVGPWSACGRGWSPRGQIDQEMHICKISDILWLHFDYS